MRVILPDTEEEYQAFVAGIRDKVAKAANAREAVGLLPADMIAARIKVTGAYVRHIRSNKRPVGRTERLAMIVGVLDLTPEQVYASLKDWWPEHFKRRRPIKSWMRRKVKARSRKRKA